MRREKLAWKLSQEEDYRTQLPWIGKEKLSSLDLFLHQLEAQGYSWCYWGSRRRGGSGLLKTQPAVTSETLGLRRLCGDLLMLDMPARDPHTPQVPKHCTTRLHVITGFHESSFRISRGLPELVLKEMHIFIFCPSFAAFHEVSTWFPSSYGKRTHIRLGPSSLRDIWVLKSPLKTIGLLETDRQTIVCFHWLDMCSQVEQRVFSLW